MIEEGMPDPRVRFFDRIAASWDQDEQSPAKTLERMESLVDMLDLHPGQDLLEIGCGTGQLTGWLAGKVAPGRVVATDFSAAMLGIAGGKESGATLYQADICAERPAGGPFDVVLSFHSFPHYRDQAAALANIAAVLKPGGRLIVMHLNSWRGVNHFHTHVGQEVENDHRPTPEQWPALLEKAGLRQERLVDEDDLFVLIGRNAQ
ncbi:MAG: class I SAM-dependent methyltransferase [Phycisphaerae bacterium]